MFAREAGHYALQARDNMEVASSKDGEELIASNIVTEVDQYVGAFAEDFFSRMFPGCLVIQEETADQLSADQLSGGKLIFVVDPIDGTLFYANRNFAWTVSVGVFYGWQPVASCIYAPQLRDFYYTEGEGSFLNGSQINAVSRLDSLKGAILLRHIKPYFCIDTFPGYSMSLGSVALHLALVASGFACGCVASRHRFWDIAGGVKLLANAGAEIRYLDGGVPEWRELIENLTARPRDYFFAGPKGDFEELSKYVEVKVRFD